MSNQRSYKASHPWINFQIDLTTFNSTCWMQLGEITSKTAHLLSVPVRPDLAKKLHEVWFVRGAHATTSIEGNTLSEQEVGRLMQGDLELPESRAYQGQEVQNVLRAFSVAAKYALDDETEGTGLSVERLCEFNRICLGGLEHPPEVEPGCIRRHSVTVGRYLGAPHRDCEFLLEKLCAWLDETWCPDDEKWRRYNSSIAAVKAIVAHLYLAWIHPFGDGNGRCARLVELYLLMRAGFPSSAAHLLSNHYNQTRDQYYRKLSQASRAHEAGFSRSVLPFIEYSLQGLVDGLALQIQEVTGEQIRVAWKDFVYTEFGRNKPSGAQKRRRDLAIAVGLNQLKDTGSEWLSKDNMAILTPGLAKAYRQKGDRTIARDANNLVEMGIFHQQEGTSLYGARLDLLHRRFSIARLSPTLA